MASAPQISYTNSWPGTGAVVLSSVSNTGTGTFSSWTVTLDIESIKIRRMYRQNEIVRHNGRWYLSLHDSNVGNQPTGNTDSHWELIVWSNGRLYPPDDVRLLTTDLYAVKGIGLVPAIDPATDRYFFKGRLKYKPKQ